MNNKLLAGKVCAITGPTSGIGRATALALGEKGARLLLLCRSVEKGEELARHLRMQGTQADVVQCNLSSLSAVAGAAQQVRDLAPRLDLLINNAGLVNQQRRVTVDGLEEMFAVNHLAHFLLTTRLLPSLQAAPKARIVHVASDAHHFVRGSISTITTGSGAAFAPSRLTVTANSPIFCSIANWPNACAVHR